jgi:hypothetical protein
MTRLRHPLAIRLSCSRLGRVHRRPRSSTRRELAVPPPVSLSTRCRAPCLAQAGQPQAAWQCLLPFPHGSRLCRICALRMVAVCSRTVRRLRPFFAHMCLCVCNRVDCAHEKRRFKANVCCVDSDLRLSKSYSGNREKLAVDLLAIHWDIHFRSTSTALT